MSTLSRSLFLVWLATLVMRGFADELKTPEPVRVVIPLLQGHAHNDYEHPRPLLDALDQGYCSIEADIWLVGGQLLVAHDRAAVEPVRTLQAMYLDPLRERIRRNGGRVYRQGPPCILLVDVKSAAEPTYLALRKVLQGYTEILTTFTTTNTTTNALAIILSGNQATRLVAAEELRYVAIDGRLTDLDSGLPPQTIPLISDNWTKQFQWRGLGPLPDDERQKLRQLVGRAHAHGRRIRFWAAPDTPAGWGELQSAGVDLISTDDLPGLANFLRASPSAPVGRSPF